MRQTIDFNGGWKFALGHAGNAERDFGYGIVGKAFAKSGENAQPLNFGFDDSAWEDVTLPHDWTVREKPVYSATATADSHGYRPFGIEYPDKCIGWYRKKFIMEKEPQNKRVFVRFDGAYRDMQVWVNAVYVGRNESGYIGETYDITDMLYADKENIIVCRLDASQPEGWFYEGCGIYRPVYLEITDRMHINDGELFIKSKLRDKDAVVSVEVGVTNMSYSNCICETVCEIYRKGEKLYSETKKQGVASWENEKFFFDANIIKPLLWSPEEPNLYTCIIKTTVDGIVNDSTETEFGIREFTFDADRGFFVNGVPTKIKGVCCHQDHAGVGSAIPDALWEYRIRLLKEMGVNAYRCSHNPPSPYMLSVCDRLGMLVMDENRLLSSGKENAGQMERLVRRDRNHASVFIWSIANEEGGIQDGKIGEKTAKTMIRICKKLDDTRLTTYAGNNGGTYSGCNSVVDVRGWNYCQIGGIEALDRYHEEHPQQFMIGTEEGSTVSTRGIYTENPSRGYVEAYGDRFPGWGCSPAHWWSRFAVRDYLPGSFVWTGFDYRGEPTPYRYPNINSHFGIMDTCGFPKDIYYYYKANWTDCDVLHVFPHWSLDVAEGTAVKVRSFTNCDEVELFVNGMSKGRQTVGKYGFVEWNVDYVKGELRAVGKRNGKTVETLLKTAGKAHEYRVCKNTVGEKGREVTVFNIAAYDENGVFCPLCSDLLKFEFNGAGRIIGVGNGDPSDHSDDYCKDGNWRRSLFNGLCSVIAEGTGELIITKQH